MSPVSTKSNIFKSTRHIEIPKSIADLIEPPKRKKTKKHIGVLCKSESVDDIVDRRRLNWQDSPFPWWDNPPFEHEN